MEDKNMAREEISEQNLEDVVGGKFTFTKKDGKPVCKVTGYGTYQTTEDGVFKYMSLRNANPTLSEAEYLQMCLDQHIIW